ncbi:retrotransposon protein, putative, ty1-copia subclass [Tanacetum coccineum]
MHNMGKTIGEIHAMLIEYEKGLPKKAETPQVMMIKSGKIQKANKKSLNAKGKNKAKMMPATTVRSRTLQRNCPVYLAEFAEEEVKHNLDSTYLWHCRLAHISKKRIKQLQQDGLLKSTDDESFDKCESCLSGKMTHKNLSLKVTKGQKIFWNHTYRRVCKHAFSIWLPTKKVDKTPYDCGIGNSKLVLRKGLGMKVCKLQDAIYGLKQASRSWNKDVTMKSKDDTKSPTEYVFVLNGGAVDSEELKQSTTGNASTESHTSLHQKLAMERIVWIRNLSHACIVPTINEL